MSFIDRHSGLYTDHYELLMAEGYYLSGLAEYTVCFDYFFRKNHLRVAMGYLQVFPIF
jgi:nicotinate phosphoribosyltransferase